MNINYKKLGVAFVITLLLTMCLLVAPALAEGISDGTSATSSLNEKTSVSSISQGTSSSSEEMSIVPTAEVIPSGDEYDINLNLLNTSSTKYTVDSVNHLITLTDSNGSYTVSGSTSTYGIKASVNSTIILSGAEIKPSFSNVFPIDLSGQTVTLVLASGSTTTIDGSLANTAGILTTSGTITIEGSGSMQVTGGTQNAGIGGWVLKITEP